MLDSTHKDLVMNINKMFWLKVVRRMLQEASTIFCWEPEETDEGHLAVIATKELKDVELFIKTLD